MGISIRWTWGVVMVALVTVAAGASETPTSAGCVTALTTCGGPLKNSSETPPAMCCIPLENAVKTEKECVCGILNNPTLLYAYNVTTDEIFNLAARCNISDASPSLCSGVPTSSPAAVPPAPGKNSGSTYDVIAWSGIALILAVMATLMF